MYDSELKQLDEIVFIPTSYSQDVYLKDYFDVIKKINTSFKRTLLKTLKIAIIAHILVVSYFTFFSEPLPLTQLIYTLVPVTVTTIIMEHYIKFSTPKDLTKMRREQYKKQKHLALLKILVIVPLLSLGYFFITNSDIDAKIVYLIILFIFCLESFVEVQAIHSIATTDITIKKYITKNQTERINTNALILIDSTGQPVQLNGISYSQGNHDNVKFERFSNDLNTEFAYDSDYFNPEIDSESLKDTEEIVRYHEYIESVIGSEFNTKQRISLVVSPDKMKDWSIDTDRNNPYYLTADDLEQLENNNRLDEYFDKYDS